MLIFQVVAKSQEQVHYFNAPFQLTQPPEGRELNFLTPKIVWYMNKLYLYLNEALFSYLKDSFWYLEESFTPKI